MKYLFCGLGSIGKRHLNNLLSIGEKDIIAYRKFGYKKSDLNHSIKVYNDLDDALNEKPDAAFITNPTSEHIPISLKVARAKCHLFIEKPLSSSYAGIPELNKICHKNKLITMMGFMLRFHPAVQKIKQIIEKKEIGDILYARLIAGDYLPNWHPWEDYRKGYAANKNLGGGPINTISHELDLVSFFFGMPKSVFALEGKQTPLKLTTEHSADILAKYKNGLTTHIRLDYHLYPAQRQWEVYGTKGRVNFDFYTNIITINIGEKKNKEFRLQEINFSKSFKVNDLYIEELKHFINTIKSKQNYIVTLKDGINNLKIILACHKSIENKTIIYL